MKEYVLEKELNGLPIGTTMVEEGNGCYITGTTVVDGQGNFINWEELTNKKYDKDFIKNNISNFIKL